MAGNASAGSCTKSRTAHSHAGAWALRPAARITLLREIETFLGANVPTGDASATAATHRIARVPCAGYVAAADNRDCVRFGRRG